MTRPTTRIRRSEETAPEINELGQRYGGGSTGFTTGSPRDGADVDAVWLGDVRRRLFHGCSPKPSENTCSIFKVPLHIRNLDVKAYEPTILYIGLFNSEDGQWRNPWLHNLKEQCVRYLIARPFVRSIVAGTGGVVTAEALLDKCLREMMSLEPQARSCYSEDDEDISNKEFAEIMLRDGCFILYLLLKQAQAEDSRLEVVVVQDHGELVNQEVQERRTAEEVFMSELRKEILEAPLHSTLWVWKLVVHDLLKLENQIPFFVVQKLFDLLKTPADESIDLVEQAIKLFSNSGVRPRKAETFRTMPSSQVRHLLHLFHSSLIPPKYDTDLTSDREIMLRAPEWIPCATELREAGIKFRRKEAAESFLEVTFKDGVMEMPSLQVDDTTTSVFRNLIAFEQCFPATRTHITVYAAFMDCIVNAEKDVSLLKLNGILLNRLGTEQEAADLFNKLCHQIYCASDRNYLWELYIDVTEYCKSKWHIWRAALVRNYFSNPWAVISVIAAAVLLILTVEQAFFAAASYFHH